MEITATPNFDLKWSLTLRVVAVALGCFLVASALTLLASYREVRQANEQLADIVGKQLQMQLIRIDNDLDLAARFPDWDPVTQSIQGPGQCVQFVRPDGSMGRSSCIGFNRDGNAPAWFSSLGAWLFAGRTDAVRSISYRGNTSGTLVITTEPAAVLAAIWKDVSGLLGLTAMLVIATCLLQFAAISRALRPTKDVLAGLDRLTQGDLTCRLPSFRLIELQRISEVFNRLAAALDRTTRERSALAARLVEGHEQERRHLARELHDELGQNLSAMSAVATSIKAAAQVQCPALLPEANSLAQTSMAMMKSLRATLRNLRPPEIDDLGLVVSLSALAREQEQRTAGKLNVSLEVDGDFQDLPPTASSHLYRIVQEGLTNIGRHANASRARVALRLRSQPREQAEDHRRWLELTIEDDGLGMADHRGGADDGSFGLIGMRERAMALGGRLDVADLGERGVRLHATIPL